MGIGQLLSTHKEEMRFWSDATTSERAKRRQRAAFFHSGDLHYLKFLIPEGSRVMATRKPPVFVIDCCCSAWRG